MSRHGQRPCVAAGHDVHVAGRDRAAAAGLELTVPTLPACRGRPAAAAQPAHEHGARPGGVPDLSPDLVHAHCLPEFGWMAAREGSADRSSARPGGRTCSGCAELGLRRSRRALDALGSRPRRLRASRPRVARAREPGRARRGRCAGASTSIASPRAMPDGRPGARSASRPTGRSSSACAGSSPIYNPELLLDAFAELRKRQPDARLAAEASADEPATGARRDD